ncbi:tail fiber assembly protein [Xenorhabdus bovienii]|uniref:tail fiber assembly protein n=1 Tax=Xenorhabdus bovienii TaxID=40576 RepID=UPI001EE1381A|nr:tail fiber assembly protein [Xenorhabdus bovienii]MCG3461557.1 tail fiber assembly protein [Xenorhabdus bovienii]
MYLISEAGEDWYQLQDKYPESTVKIEYEPDGTIIRHSTDVSRLVPVGRSIAEVKSLPDGFENGEWVFDGNVIKKKVKSHAQHITEAETKKRSLIFKATTAIAPLQDAVDLDMATNEEKAALLAWKKYRVLLNRVDCTTAPDVKWPEQPK